MATIPIRCSMVSILVMRGSGDATQVLLVQRAGEYLRGVWSYVGGHIEAGELAWRSALRELHEETRLIPVAFHSANYCEQFYDPREECIAIVPAFVALVSEDAPVRLNREHDAFRWLRWQEAMSVLPFGSQRDLFAHVRREFIERAPPPQLRIGFDEGSAQGSIYEWI